MRMATLAAMAVLGLAAPAGAGQTRFVVVDGGARAVIVVPPSPSGSETLAAGEIARYVEQMSGAKLEVKKTSDPPVGAVVVSRLGPEQGDLGEEGYTLAIRNRRLYVSGARERSVLYAAYDLLQRLGCRWLAPKFDYYGERAEVVPRQSKLVVELANPIVEKPRLKFRKLYVEEGHSHTQENLLQMTEWMSKSRHNTLVVPTNYQGAGRVRWDNWRETLTPELKRRDIQIEVGGHGYENFINAEMEGGRLFEQHPDWFGMADGKRNPHHRFVFCTSNPAAVDYVTDNVLAYLQARPEIDIFDFWPPDGAQWCECPECGKLGPPQDRQSRLVAHVIREAEKRGVKAHLETIAYASAIDLPANPPMDKSVLIDFCPISQCFEVQINDPASEINAKYASQVSTWARTFTGEVSIYSYYRKYAWRSLPVIIPHYMQQDLRWYGGIGTAGISSYAEPGDWRTYELNHYTLARLAWNCDADADAIVSDFCAARFGKAAGEGRKLYAALEDTVRMASSIPNTKLKTAQDIDRYARQLRAAREPFAKASGDTRQAAALTAAADYALRDFALQKHIAEGGSAAERAKMVDEMVEFIGSHAGQGIFLGDHRLGKESLSAVYKAGN